MVTISADDELSSSKSCSGRHILKASSGNRRRSSLAAGFKCLLFDLGVVVKQKGEGEDMSATTTHKKVEDFTTKNVPTLARNNPVGPPFIFVTE